MAQAGLPSLLFLLWWGRRVDTSGEAIRDFGLQSGLDRVGAQLAGLAAEWPIPGGLMGAVWPGGAALVGAIALAAGVALVWYASRAPEWKHEPRKAVVRCALLYMACYLPVVVASRLFADPRIPFDARIFFPVLVLSTVLAIAAAVSVARSRGRTGWALLGIVACGWAVAAASEVRQGVTAVNEYGLYFTSVGWADDPVLRWVVDRSAPYATVYSNEPAMIYFLTGRHAKSLPLVGEDIDAFARQLARMPGPVVFIAPSHVTDVAPQLLVDRLAVERVVGSGMAALYLPTAAVPNP